MVAHKIRTGTEAEAEAEAESSINQTWRLITPRHHATSLSAAPIVPIVPIASTQPPET